MAPLDLVAGKDAVGLGGRGPGDLDRGWGGGGQRRGCLTSRSCLQGEKGRYDDGYITSALQRLVSCTKEGSLNLIYYMYKIPPSYIYVVTRSTTLAIANSCLLLIQASVS